MPYRVFTAKDPIGFNGGDTNVFLYTLDDPVNWIDPTGLCEGATKGVTEKIGLFYDENGHIIGERGLEDPNPFFDPVNYLGGATGWGLKTALEIETTYLEEGNIFKIISKRLRAGFRIDPAHHGKLWGHIHFWHWWGK